MPIRADEIADFLDESDRFSDILHHSQQGERNRVCERKRKGFSFTDSQQTRFLAVVQDVSSSAESFFPCFLSS